MHWYLEVLKKYAVFSGRARRKEYWMFALVNIIIAVLLGILEAALGIGGRREQYQSVLGGLYSLAVLLPTLGVTVRRFHDTGRSGWWILLSFIPLIGSLIVLFFLVQDSEPGENRYGPNPKAMMA